MLKDKLRHLKHFKSLLEQKNRSELDTVQSNRKQFSGALQNQRLISKRNWRIRMLCW